MKGDLGWSKSERGGWRCSDSFSASSYGSVGAEVEDDGDNGNGLGEGSWPEFSYGRLDIWLVHRTTRVSTRGCLWVRALYWGSKVETQGCRVTLFKGVMSQNQYRMNVSVVSLPPVLYALDVDVIEGYGQRDGERGASDSGQVNLVM